MRSNRKIYVVAFKSGKSKMYNNPSELYEDLKQNGLYEMSFVNLERSMYKNKFTGVLTEIIDEVKRLEPYDDLFTEQVDTYLSTLNSSHPNYRRCMKNKYLKPLIDDYVAVNNAGINIA